MIIAAGALVDGADIAEIEELGPLGFQMMCYYEGRNDRCRLSRIDENTKLELVISYAELLKARLSSLSSLLLLLTHPHNQSSVPSPMSAYAFRGALSEEDLTPLRLRSIIPRFVTCLRKLKLVISEDGCCGAGGGWFGRDAERLGDCAESGRANELIRCLFQVLPRIGRQGLGLNFVRGILPRGSR